MSAVSNGVLRYVFMNVTSERWPEAITTGVTQPTSFPCMERGFYYLDLYPMSWVMTI